MKKCLLGLFVLIFSTSVFADNMNSKMFHIFSSSITKSDHNLTQTYIGQSSDSYSKLRNSCGTVAALAVHNYFNLRLYGSVDGFTISQESVENSVVDIFNNSYLERNDNGYVIGDSEIGNFQDGNNIAIDLAKNRWGWDVTKIRSTSIGYNYNNMIEWDLKNDRPVIVLVKSYSEMNNHNVEHFVVITYASDTQVGYFDPWDGSMKIVTKQQFLNSWVATNYGVVIKEILEI